MDGVVLMAGQQNIVPEETDEDTVERPLTLDEILGADNIADLLPANTLTKIGADVVRDYAIDIESRKTEGWDKRNETAMKAAMQKREAKDSPWPGASNVKYPLLTTAAIQFQARAYPAIVDGSNLVKGRVLGPDNGVPEVGPDGQPMMQPGPDGQPQPVWKEQPGEKRDRADRVANHMTWQLLFRMNGWEEDTDRLLLMLPIIGCAVRKTYYDTILGSNVSMMIAPDDFVVNYWTKSLDTAPRMTHVLRYYPYEARERIVTGIWREVPVDSDAQDDKAQAEDETALVRFYEQHRLIDLDEDGYPEPYVVTTTSNGEVARIAACFALEDVKTVKDKKTGESTIARIQRQEYFTKYGFIPAPDGSFYDIAFGMLLGDMSATIDTILNQMIDAASLANSQGGFLGSGVNMKSGNMKFRLGEWKRVDVTGGNLRDNIMPLTLNGPSPVLFQLLGLLIEAAKDVTSVQDIMTGGPSTSQTATTTMAQVEQGMKAFTGIFKRIHRAFSHELKILFRLNREYLDEQEYYALADTPGIVERKDYQADDLDMVPVSDPSMATDLQRMARADYLATFQGNPAVNQQEITRRRLEAGNVSDIKGLMNVPPPPPDPAVVIKGAELAIKKIEAETRKTAAEADAEVKRSVAAVNFANAAKTMVEIGLDPDAALLAGASVEQVGEVEHGELADQPGGVPAMGGPSGDEGIQGVPGALPEVPDGGMGGGEDLGPGAAGPSGIAGPTDAPQFG